MTTPATLVPPRCQTDVLLASPTLHSKEMEPASVTQVSPCLTWVSAPLSAAVVLVSLVQEATTISARPASLTPLSSLTVLVHATSATS